MSEKKELNNDDLGKIDGGIDVRKDTTTEEDKAVWIGGNINPDENTNQ